MSSASWCHGVWRAWIASADRLSYKLAPASSGGRSRLVQSWSRRPSAPSSPITPTSSPPFAVRPFGPVPRSLSHGPRREPSRLMRPLPSYSPAPSRPRSRAAAGACGSAMACPSFQPTYVAARGLLFDLGEGDNRGERTAGADIAEKGGEGVKKTIDGQGTPGGRCSRAELGRPADPPTRIRDWFAQRCGRPAQRRPHDCRATHPRSRSTHWAAACRAWQHRLAAHAEGKVVVEIAQRMLTEAREVEFLRRQTARQPFEGPCASTRRKGLGGARLMPRFAGFEAGIVASSQVNVPQCAMVSARK
jgi:hypothetical protein